MCFCTPEVRTPVCPACIPFMLARINELQRECEDHKNRASNWKQIAEFQYALRVYPQDLELGQGALDAYYNKWVGHK